MKYIIFFILAIIAYVLISIFTYKISKMKEYISFHYDTFSFENSAERKYGLNVLIAIAYPIIYTVICAGIIYKLELNFLIEDIYIISILYYAIRWFLIIFISRRKDLMDWKNEILLAIICIVLNIIVYNLFILKTENIFISLDDIKNEIWIAIITFIFIIIRDYLNNYITVNNKKSYMRKRKYISKRYNRFKIKYDELIKTDDKELKEIVYAIMIYENFNRPSFIRMFEYLKLLITGRATIGVMQFNSNILLTNKQSVKCGFEKIQKDYERNKKFAEKNMNSLAKEKNNKSNNITIKEKIEKRTINNYNFGDKYYKEVKIIKDIISTL